MLPLRINQKMVLPFSISLLFILDLTVIVPLQINRLLKISSEIKKIQANLTQFEECSLHKDKLFSQKKKIKKEIELLQRKIITAGEVSALLAYISDEAKKNNVEIIRVSPLEKQIYKQMWLGNLYYLPISIKAKAKYHNLGRFLNQLVGSKYFLSVEKLTIKQNLPRHKIELLIYSLLKEKEK